MNFVKFLRIPFYIEHLWWLLLKTRRVFMQKQPSKAFFKNSAMRNFVELTRKHFPEPTFFIKLNSVDLQICNETLAQDFSCKFCKIRKSIFFTEHHQTAVSDYSSINSIGNEGRIGKRNCKL